MKITHCEIKSNRHNSKPMNNYITTTTILFRSRQFELVLIRSNLLSVIPYLFIHPFIETSENTRHEARAKHSHCQGQCVGV